jgi:hypothetical protein
VLLRIARHWVLVHVNGPRELVANDFPFLSGGGLHFYGLPTFRQPALITNRKCVDAAA